MRKLMIGLAAGFMLLASGPLFADIECVVITYNDVIQGALCCDELGCFWIPA